MKTQKEWDSCTPLEERIQIWRKAADLMANKYRQDLNAATMLGQAKVVIQAEIDSAAELIDFFRCDFQCHNWMLIDLSIVSREDLSISFYTFRFNAFFAKELTKYQPISENPNVTLNSMRYRGIDGFIAAVSPFNFTAIGGNLAYTPALMVN